MVMVRAVVIVVVMMMMMIVMVVMMVIIRIPLHNICDQKRAKLLCVHRSIFHGLSPGVQSQQTQRLKRQQTAEKGAFRLKWQGHYCEGTAIQKETTCLSNSYYRAHTFFYRCSGDGDGNDRVMVMVMVCVCVFAVIEYAPSSSGAAVTP
jgi:hypothetical protein